MNKFVNHVYVIPEDDANRQIAVGFIGHHNVLDGRLKVMPAAGGWRHVLETFTKERYAQKLRNLPKAHVVMLIDFDGRVDERITEFESAIPEDVKQRVFVVGSLDEPETLKKALGMGYEEIGASLADDCDAGTSNHWDDEQLRHNDAERQRLIKTVWSFLAAQPHSQ